MNGNGVARRPKKRKLSPEAQFREALDHCSKSKDLAAAISLYESASFPTLTINNLNSFLYICSNSLEDPELCRRAIDFGLKLFNVHADGNLKLNEATLTSAARLAAANGDGDYAFQLAKSVKDYGVLPKLRTFIPALMFYCKSGQAEKAYQVEESAALMELELDESALAALLEVSVDTERENKVYEFLHKLRTLRGVRASTMEIMERWFKSKKAAEVGVLLDSDQIKEALMKNGDGWHGLGWVGRGEWVTCRSNVKSDGRCCACDNYLVCADIKREETENFAQSIASLATVREAKTNFREFQEWIEQHSEYEAVIDGANIGLFNQNHADGGFSLSQVEAVVNQVYNKTKKWPLVVLHNKRVRSLLEDASKREMIENWIDQGVLYGTPYGSNDDWYWLYAAVKLKCLLVTNDEMRDHIFELLGSNFFLRWKERHQVRYTASKGELNLVMPPAYSIVIQESENSWHVPMADNVGEESLRTWLCATRRSEPPHAEEEDRAP